MKNLTLIFNDFEHVHLGKDVFLMPYHLGKALGYQVTIVFPRTATNVNLPAEYKGVKLVALEYNKPNKLIKAGSVTWSYLPFYTYLIRNARKIDILMLFHTAEHPAQMAWLYKKLNRHGKVYLKLDGIASNIARKVSTQTLRGRLKRNILSQLPSVVDYVSCETSTDLARFSSSDDQYYDYDDKLIMIPNGFDEDLLAGLDINVKTQPEKENLIITVGRIGTFQKNNETLLKALDGMDMGDWQVICIGPVSESFKSAIEEHYKNNPHHIGKLLFTGNIVDKKELWEYYNRAKVFVLTSRCESYGLVLNEARRFNEYIISTRVGASADLVRDGKDGQLIDVGDVCALRVALSNVISGKTDLSECDNTDKSTLSYDYVIKPLVNRIIQSD